MSPKKLENKAHEIYQRLAGKYPHATIELNYSNPLELTVATILSAQCTDKKVNKITPYLFQKYQSPADYLKVPRSELEDDIRPLGFYRRKSESLQKLMEELRKNHNSKIPQDIDSLTALPGIGRKTANIILGNAFGIPGIAVDTHVKRVSNRLGLSTEKTPEKIEQDLMELYPTKSIWTDLSHLLVFHGRYTCKAAKPACRECPVTDLCNYYNNSGNS
ncbi:MAG: endonuclease III [Verrucomicrobiota bacterium]